jgi:hypothetical protein
MSQNSKLTRHIDIPWVTWDPRDRWWQKETRVGETRCFDCVVISSNNILYTFIIIVGGVCKLKYNISVSKDAKIFAMMWVNKYDGELRHFAETSASTWVESKSLIQWNKSDKFALIHRHTLKNGKIRYPQQYIRSKSEAIKITDLMVLFRKPIPPKKDLGVFICPITMKIMMDPVICPEGHTFERVAIESWLSKNETNPLTRNRLTLNMLIPNIALRNAIQQMM